MLRRPLSTKVPPVIASRGDGISSTQTDLSAARILILDDEPSNVRLLERVLGSRGYQNVRSSTDPTEILRIWDEFEPHLLLLDLMMPGLDGIGVMEELRSTSRVTDDARPPILVLTADATSHAREISLAEGATDLITKPFDVDEVMDVIRRLLEQELSS